MSFIKSSGENCFGKIKPILSVRDLIDWGMSPYDNQIPKSCTKYINMREFFPLVYSWNKVAQYNYVKAIRRMK